MKIACIDLEGVLIPELWPLIAQATGISALSITTRDEPDYPALMEWRIRRLRQNGLHLRDVQAVLCDIAPYPEAQAFLHCLEHEYELHIVSDCFYELVAPLLRKLGSPRSYCHSLETDKDDWITACRWADRLGKEDHVAKLLEQNAQVLAVGDAFNDLAMLRLAHDGFLVRPSGATRAVSGDLYTVEHLTDILVHIGISGAFTAIQPERGSST